MSGLENAVSLNYLYFKNCDLASYDTVKKLTDLEYLYLGKSCDDEVNNLFMAMAGIDYNKLQYLGIFGVVPVFPGNDYSGTPSGEKSSVSDISVLNNLTVNTKLAVNYLYLNNNNIVDINCLKGFLNVKLLEISNNSIADFGDSCRNMSKLITLIARKNKLRNLNGIEDLELVNLGLTYNELTTISGINPTNLFHLDLRSNNSLVDVADIAKCEKLAWLRLEGCPNMNHSDVKLFAKLYNRIPILQKSIDSAFNVDLETDDIKNWDSKNLSDDNLKDLENNNYLTKLNLGNNLNLRWERIVVIFSRNSK